MLPVVVLKFGSSVLRGPEDLPLAVDEVYRRIRSGSRILAVVSAFAGDTDRLIDRAGLVLGEGAVPEAVAAYVATGEVQSAALMTGALLRAGVAARQIDPREIQFCVAGNSLEADPLSVNPIALREFWETHTTLVLPGFFGIGTGGCVALLGRGGSDMTALYLAGALKAECHLIKDVPGVFDRDPAANPLAARRYSLIPWRDTAAVAGRLIQPKALKFAAQRQIEFSVGRANGARETRIAAAPAPLFAAVEEGPKPLKVTLLGFGTVGGGVYQRLCAHPDKFNLAAVVTRNPAKAIARGLPASLSCAELDRALMSDIGVVIECIGGIEAAGSVIKKALSLGKLVVSANKAAIAAHWPDMVAHTREPNRRLWFSAAVGGAVPMIETLTNLGDQVQEIRGVLSSTCNFVLDIANEGGTFEAAVSEAQAAGLAEADPSRDLSGLDAADKLRLIVYTVFGARYPLLPFTTRGIRGPLMCDETHLWRQLSRAVKVDGSMLMSVAPERVERNSFLGQTKGAENRLEVLLKDGRIERLVGQGAGRWPTTTAVMADVLELVRRGRTTSVIEACA